MEPLLVRLEEAYRRTRGEYLASLAPGIDAPDLPSDVAALLKWRNGHVEPDEAETLWGKFRLMALDEIIEVREEMNEMLEGDEWDDPDWWNLQYVPFATDGSSDYLLVDVEDHLGGDAGAVIDFDHKSNMRLIVVPSFRRFIETLCETVEADPGDGRAQRAFFFEANPGYPIFKFVGQ